MPQNWVARLVEEEKRKDQAHTREIAGALHHLDDLPAPKLLELVPDNEQGFAVHVKENQGQAFRGVEQLSEYLLVPLFTGHPR